MLVKSKKEPWGQTVSRFIGPDRKDCWSESLSLPCARRKIARVRKNEMKVGHVRVLLTWNEDLDPAGMAQQHAP
jgi:hypothetical protein